jgi:hypothetical protein
LAGHLLLLLPEEDAFWIFVSMTDTHLRPYFSPNAVQMEVNAFLFSKVLEVHDPPLSKTILFDLGVTAAAFCRPWYVSNPCGVGMISWTLTHTLRFGCSVFAETLPTEYLCRVRDLFGVGVLALDKCIFRE